MDYQETIFQLLHDEPRDLGFLLFGGSFVSRTKGNDSVTYEDLSNSALVENADIIVNTTPLGMYPNITQAPKIPYDKIKKNSIAFDLIYNPETTEFLNLAQQRGAIIKNGLEMLELQAQKSWEIWNG